MSNREKVPFKTSVTIRLVAPTDVVSVPKDPLNNTDNGSTCTFKVYDPAKDEVLSAAEASGQTVLSVTNAAKFKIGDVTEVALDSGTLQDFTLTGIDPTAGTITGSPSLTGPAASGNRVRVRLGPQVTMTEYGTPELETLDWGFQGSMASTHPGLVLDLEIDVEISFVGNPSSASLDLLEVLCLVIKLKKDCPASV